MADQVTMETADVIGTSSFNTAGNWSSVLAPEAGNDYIVYALYLRTPPDAESHTFAGDSLTLYSGGGLLYKGTGTTGVLTIDPLILDGGLVDHASSNADEMVIDGTMEVSFNSTIDSRQGPITFLSDISGSSQLTLNSSGGNGYPVTFGGGVALTSDLVTNTSFVLNATGKMSFTPESGGYVNMITGTGSVTINGVFDIDLDLATSSPGDSWSLVDSSLGMTFGESFSVQDFTEVNGFWTSPSGVYQFDERTGILSVVTDDSDGDGLPDSWETEHFGNLSALPDGDADGDLASNLLEYQSGTDPLDAASFPDTDTDGLNDGWEIAYFGNLDATPEGDADADYNSNLTEYLAGTSPVDFLDFPDEDGDGMNDGWELLYFDTIEDCDPSVDSDGDLYTNFDEAIYETDPTDPFSSPDSENFDVGDGLPDGWEVYWFGAEGESLETIIAKYTGEDDPDGDGFSNLSEYGAGTDPTDPNDAPLGLTYWRFEEATTGSVPGGEATGTYTMAVLDSVNENNSLRTWNEQTAPAYTTDVPASVIPATGEANTASLYFDAGTDGTWGDIVWTDTQAPLRWKTFEAWTIEASFKLDPTLNGTANQAVMSKDGNPEGGTGQPPFHLKYLGATQKFEVGLIDGSGTVRYLVSNRTINAGEWYSVATTADATTLSLWIKGEGEAAYTLDSSMSIDGAFYNDFTGLNDAWAVGRARWNGSETDWFKGWIDEVRINEFVLPESKFLFHEDSEASPYDLWAAANIPDSSMRGESDDADGDGTVNHVEYLLGLDPVDSSSRFMASVDVTGTISWPAASGLQFSISRSVDLSTWVEVATSSPDTSSGSWSDPSPPEGRAFYRVELVE